MVVNCRPTHADIALLEDGDLVELHQEKGDQKFAVGDVFLGRVKKILSSLNAAFVNIGNDKDAFLHYSDLGSQFKSFQSFTDLAIKGTAVPEWHSIQVEEVIPKTGTVKDVLTTGQNILVQIVKEPISTKGPRLTTRINLTGRYVVLLPFSTSVNVSRKIKQNEERNRLKKIINPLLPPNCGIIIRTVAENQMADELAKDVELLIEKWKGIASEIKFAVAPERLYTEMSKTSSILRDILNSSFNHIYVNDKSMSVELANYIRQISPGQENIVEYYSGKNPIFDQYKVAKQIKQLFGKTVGLSSGAYLILEQTEAMYVIDVNSGHKASNQHSQENNAFLVNSEAGKEIARQIRLRDLGGIIVVDFIDMKSSENRRKLLESITDEMKKDRAKHSILPVTKFGLMQITRQRTKPVLEINSAELCPTCMGSGKVKATLLLMDEIESSLQYLLMELNYKKISIELHPFIGAYLTKGLWSKQMRWLWHYKTWIEVKANSSLNLTEYKFLDIRGEDIKL